MRQTPPRDTSTRRPDSTGRVVMPRPPADTDTTKRSNVLGIPGIDVAADPAQPPHRSRRPSATENLALQLGRDRAGQRAHRLPRELHPPGLVGAFSIKSAGTIGDRVHVEHRLRQAARVRRVEHVLAARTRDTRASICNASTSATSPSPRRRRASSRRRCRLATTACRRSTSSASCTCGRSSRGRRATSSSEPKIHDGRPRRSNRPTATSRTTRSSGGASSSRSIPRCSAGYPNIDILNRAQLTSICARVARHAPADARAGVSPAVRRAAAEPERTAVSHSAGDPGRGAQTYDLLREGVDYVIDPSQLWFALVRPLIQTNERLVVAYNVRLQRARHGVDDDGRHARSLGRPSRTTKSRIS